VRQYRSQAYDTFGKRPRDLVDRQEAWYRIWSAWEKAGSPPEQQDRLMDWLAGAIKVSSKDAIGPLPADPKFGDDVELVSEQFVKQLAQPPAARPDGTRPAAARQAADDFLAGPQRQARGPLPVRVPDPMRAIEAVKQPPETVVVLRAANIAWLPLRAEAPPAVVPPLHFAPPMAAGDPQGLTAPPAPSHRALVVVVPREARIAAESSTEMVLQARPGGARPQAIGPRRQPAELPPLRTLQPPLELPVAALPPAAAGPRAIAQWENTALEWENSAESVARRHVAIELPRRAADFALPGPQRPAEYRPKRKPLRPDAAADQPQPPTSPVAQADQHAQVNVEELGTRIEGINLSLRNLEAELQEKRDFTADQLDSLLSRLDILVLRQKDLTLFRDLIAPREQARVGQIDSSRSVVATMGTRISELRTRIHENEALPEAERAAALKHLDELSDRLATMTAEK
jgi:hypothetical protein